MSEQENQKRAPAEASEAFTKALRNPVVLKRLRKHPMVTIRADRVRTRAYFSSLSEPHKTPAEHWLNAEEVETLMFVQGLLTFPPQYFRPPQGDQEATVFDLSYETIFTWQDGVTPHEFARREVKCLGTKEPRQCSICLRKKPDVPFKMEAHILPEQLGARSLLTWDECDHCNQRAGRDHEEELGKFLIGDRAIAGTRHKRGTAKLKYPKAGGSYVGGQHHGKALEVHIQKGDPTVAVDWDGTNNATLTIKTPKYRPRGVVKSLAKMTWQALPPERRQEAEALRKYLNEEADWLHAEVFRIFVPHLTRVSLTVWRRLDEASNELPLYVTMVTSSFNVLLWATPDLGTGLYRTPLLPPVFRPPGESLTLELLKAKGDEYKTAEIRTFPLSFTRTRRLTSGPEEVALTVKSKRHEFSDVATLTTPRGASAREDGHVVYELRSEALAGLLRIEEPTQDSGYDIQFIPDAAAIVRGKELAKTRAFLAALGEGAQLKAKALKGSERTILSIDAESTEDISPALLEPAEHLASSFAVIRERLAPHLSPPDRLSAEDERTIEALADGLCFGAAREWLDAPVRAEIKLSASQARDLLARIAEGHNPIQGAGTRRWSIAGQQLEVGAVRSTFGDLRFEMRLDEVHRTLERLAPDDEFRLVVYFDSVHHEFLEFKA